MAAMLARLPSSPKDLLRRIEHQRDEIRLLHEENVRLKSREVEVSSLTLKLQQQFAATQSQVEGIKAQIQLQLAHPVSEEEYHRIDALPESQCDLLDTIKLGVYRQLGSMRASMEAATRRAADLAATTAQLDAENRDLKLELSGAKAALERERETHADKAKSFDRQAARVLELEANVKDLEAKLRNAFHDQESFLTAKLNAQVKTDEATRLSLRLEESEMDVQRYKASAECSEQKLDILKAEYYELKLTYTQRIAELESCLKAADEKLKTLGDLELESELFLSTLAQRDRDGAVPDGIDAEGAVALPRRSGAASAMTYESYMALPRSRKLAHALTVMKRCLHLENTVASLEHDVSYKDKQIGRLQVSLEAARDALRSINSPYAMVEKTMEELFTENERQKEKLRLLQEENKDLQERLSERTADIKALCGHRQELLRMRRLLRRLGVSEGYCSPGGKEEEGVGHEMAEAALGAGTPRRPLSDSTSAQKGSRSPPARVVTVASTSHDSGEQQATSSSLRQRSGLDTASCAMPGIEISS